MSATGETHPKQEFNFNLIKSFSIIFWSMPGKDENLIKFIVRNYTKTLLSLIL